jgi:CHAD domain-containing protein
MPIAPERSELVFQKMERALLKLSSKRDAESVHTFRITSRRLQTLLEEIVPERGRSHKKLLKMLDRIRKRAGKVRDIDVQLSALRSLRVPQEPRRKTQLMHSLIELRAKQDKKLRKMLNKQAIRDIQKRLRRRAKRVESEAGRDALAVAGSMVAQVARPTGLVTEDVLHRYRVVVKRARYAAEFAPKSTDATQFVADMKRLQDAVGNWHDWLTLTHTAVKRIGDVNQSSLVAALHHVTAGKFRHAVAALSASPTIRHAPKPVSVASEEPRKPGTKSLVIMDRAESAA